MIIRYIFHKRRANGLTYCIILALFPVNLPFFVLIPRALSMLCL
jgi:hypothetical protein